MDIQNLFSLAGRTALVTGGSRGIGYMIAAGFIAQGATVYISSRKADACDAAARELGDRCISVPHDISDLAGIEGLATDLAQRLPTLDILVNNAGASWGADLDQFPESGWDKVMDLNLKSPFFLIQKLLPLLRAAASPDQPSKIINIGSVDARRLNPWETYSYHASKAALQYLTRRLAARLIEDNVVVTALAPGNFASNMNKAARDYADVISKNIPSRRIGRPEEIAASAVYLASAAGDYVVGQTLVVDGGLVDAEFGRSMEAPVG